MSLSPSQFGGSGAEVAVVLALSICLSKRSKAIMDCTAAYWTYSSALWIGLFWVCFLAPSPLPELAAGESHPETESVGDDWPVVGLISLYASYEFGLLGRLGLWMSLLHACAGPSMLLVKLLLESPPGPAIRPRNIKSLRMAAGLAAILALGRIFFLPVLAWPDGLSVLVRLNGVVGRSALVLSVLESNLVFNAMFVLYLCPRGNRHLLRPLVNLAIGAAVCCILSQSPSVAWSVHLVWMSTGL